MNYLCLNYNYAKALFLSISRFDFEPKKKKNCIIVGKYDLNYEHKFRCQTDPRASNELTEFQVFRDGESMMILMVYCSYSSVRICVPTTATTLQRRCVAPSHQSMTLYIPKAIMNVLNSTFVANAILWPSHRQAFLFASLF